MRDLIITMIVFGAVPFMLTRPYIGIMIWSWLGYMNPHRLTWGFAYNMPFVQVSAICTLIGLFISKEPKRFPWTATSILWLIWTGWMILTTILSVNPVEAYPELDRSIKIQMMILVTFLVIQDKKKLDLVVWTIVISLGFFGTKGGLFTVLKGGNYMVWGPPGSFIEGNNELALALLMIVPLMRYLQIEIQNKWIKRGMGLSLLLTIFSIVGSYSRGAFLGALTMGFMLWLKSKNKVLIGVGIILCASVIWSFMPQQWFDRMNTIETYEEDQSAMGRINAWWFAFNLAKDHPIAGGGYQAFTPELFLRYAPNPTDFHDAHSIYFEVLCEQGFVGLFLFLLLGTATFFTGSWILRNTKNIDSLRWANNLGGMLQVSFVGYATGGAFLGLAYFDLPYHLMSLLVITQALVKDDLKKLPIEELAKNPAQKARLSFNELKKLQTGKEPSHA
ncbi:MAG: putative O-glycosylation ligase, exosortase A system-associated [Gammaproteobacteria bacterium]|nr:putative O-glycosylation ligase, exosortase A system-associated [Gammaproteobacteria bacterium]